MCFDSSVSFLLLSCRKDTLWFLYHSLKLVPSPTYIGLSLLLVDYVRLEVFSFKRAFLQ